MRILHTADWHMNATLGRQSLREDICQSLQQIAVYLEKHRVDVMLVAGDLFCDRSRRAQLREAMGEIKKTFLPFLQRGGTIVAISGNHDSENFFETLRDAFELVASGDPDADGLHASGRLYLLPASKLLRLCDSDGQVVQVVAMPYPNSRYLKGDTTRYQSLAERNRAIQEKFVALLKKHQEELDHKLPSILLSHVHVRGVNPHNLYQISESDDVIFEPGDIPTHWSYVAYGHIHQPQAALAGAAHVRYAGSPVRLNGGERNDQKSVVLVEIGSNELQGTPTLLPLECPPIYRVEITDPDTQLPQLVAQYPNAMHALVEYVLHWEPGKHNRDEICRHLDKIFPRCYQRQFKKIGQGEVLGGNFTAAKMRDVKGTVREYLQARLDDHRNKNELLALTEELMMEEDE